MTWSRTPGRSDRTCGITSLANHNMPSAFRGMLEIAHEYEIPSLIEGRWIVQDIMDGTDDNRVRNCVVACQQPGLSGTDDHSDVTAAHELQFNLLSLRGQRQSGGIAAQFRRQRLADEVEVDSVEHYGRLRSQFQNRRQMRFGWISAREHDDVVPLAVLFKVLAN